MIWLSVAYVIGSLVILGFIGHLLLMSEVREWNDKIEFLGTFAQKLNVFFERWARGQDANEEYGWLLEHSVKMQEQMGHLGMTAYKPAGYRPGTGVPIQAIHGCLQGIVGEERQDTFFQGLMQTALARYNGYIRDERDKSLQRASNPIRKVLYGIRAFVIAVPWIARESGLLSEKRYRQINHSWLTGCMTFLFAIIGVIASLVTISAEWDTVSEFLRRLGVSDPDREKWARCAPPVRSSHYPM